MGVEIESFEYDFLTMHCIQSGILVLFNAAIVQGGLEAAQPEASGEGGPWAVLEWEQPGAAESSALGASCDRVLLISCENRTAQTPWS